MLTASLWCLFFGATICLAVPDHSSDAKQRVVTEAGSEDELSQFNKEVNKLEWKREKLPDNNIREFENAGDLELFVRARPNNCRRHHMYIDFNTYFGGAEHNPYIAPSGFSAFRCSGECPFPHTKHMNTTLHAIAQKQMSLVDRNFKAPCCVPTTLTAINVLYNDINNVVKQKEIPEMVVEGCGCR